MNFFKKEIYKQEQKNLILSIITVDFENSNNCYNEVQVTVIAQNPINVTITGTFGTGGNYENSNLTGINQITNNFSETIIANKSYNFGIDAASGFTQNSVITVNAVDTITGDSYIYNLNRLHGSTPC